jgi:hypothetical protein
MADGKQEMKTIAIVNTDGDDFWAGGLDVTAADVPADAVSFSLFLTRWSGQGTSQSKFADINIKLIDPGSRSAGPLTPTGKKDLSSDRVDSLDGLHIRYPDASDSKKE